MAPKRKLSWLFLEWTGTLVFGVLPDVRIVNNFLSRVFYFFYNHYKFPNLRQPRYFNEKLINLKISDEARDPLRARVTDKELVKEHVTAMFGPGYVVPTLAVIRRQSEIDAYVFPLPCVVKPTHSSQEVMCFTDRQPSDEERRILKYWLRKSYFKANREPNYRHLEKKLIVEPVLGEAFGGIEDVKVLCFHGRPKLIQVDHGRYAEHRRDYFDIKGRALPISMRKPAAGLAFPFPEKLDQLLAMATKLSAGFTFIRADFYVVDGAILVGELTSFPTNCTVPFQPLSADLIIARLFEEPDLEITAALLSGADVVAFPAGAADGARAGVPAGEAEVVPFPYAAERPAIAEGETAAREESPARASGVAG